MHVQTALVQKLSRAWEQHVPRVTSRPGNYAFQIRAPLSLVPVIHRHGPARFERTVDGLAATFTALTVLWLAESAFLLSVWGMSEVEVRSRTNREPEERGQHRRGPRGWQVPPLRRASAIAVARWKKHADHHLCWFCFVFVARCVVRRWYRPVWNHSVLKEKENSLDLYHIKLYLF